MNLVDVAKYVIATEPAEGKSIVHKLGDSVACHRAWNVFNVEIIERGDKHTEILSVDLHENGSLLEGFYRKIDDNLDVIEGITTDTVNLPALASYIMDHCLERIPAGAIEELSQNKSRASNYKIA